MQETELCPSKVLAVQDAAGNVTNQAAMDENMKELKHFGRRYKKATSLITNSIDDKIVIMLKGLSGFVAMWKNLAADLECWNFANDEEGLPDVQCRWRRVGAANQASIRV